MALTGHRTSALLAASVAALGLVWWRLPASAPPLYDGICVANPYQYLQPPPGAPTTAPTSARHDVAVTGGTVPGSLAATGEFPAQAQLSTDDGSITPPSGATKVTLGVEPVPQPAVQPKDGTLDGNVYKMTVTADTGAPVSVDPGKPVTITLRGTSAGASTEVIEHFNGTSWTQLQSQPISSCAYFFSATTNSLGDFALVAPAAGAASSNASPVPGPGGSGGGGGGGFSAAMIVLASVVVLAALGIALLRRHNQRGQGSVGKPRTGQRQ